MTTEKGLAIPASTERTDGDSVVVVLFVGDVRILLRVRVFSRLWRVLYPHVRRFVDILHERGRSDEPTRRLPEREILPAGVIGDQWSYELVEAFDQSDLFPQEPWQRQYESVEKTPRIRDVERMPRPTTY